MQIIIGIALFLVVITVIIYNVNDRFEKKEFIIFLIITAICTISLLFYQSYKDNYIPNLFKQKYEQDSQNSIKSLDYELINNKVVSSKDRFIYKFTYTILKDDSEYLCVLDNIEVNKIKDEFVFINFDLDLKKQECFKKWKKLQSKI